METVNEFDCKVVGMRVVGKLPDLPQRAQRTQSHRDLIVF
jgi:hypothetical protein